MGVRKGERRDYAIVGRREFDAVTKYLFCAFKHPLRIDWGGIQQALNSCLSVFAEPGGEAMKAVAMDTAEDSISQTSDEQLVSLQIYVPELIVQKCMQFNREELIWDVKNQILAALPKELKEGFNYGLFCPPVNGRAGKFLDEERPLADYPFTDNSAYVELRYKRRIYKINMEEKQLKQLHSRANLRRLLDHIHNNHVEKITKMCSRGLDPNFHCQETGGKHTLFIQSEIVHRFEGLSHVHLLDWSRRRRKQC
ncbi:protein shank [Caerostris darwini]|uniref:Protein shank n=1 Tax=Caerostris darwini TaxID=1538125 RepID=A0AAV4MUH4_9ARAC|nr:protein shank [Caerostris darwini]